MGNNIPAEKLNNARAYFPIQRQEKVIGLIDCTVFGSCKVGLAITHNGFTWKNDWTTDSTQTTLTWQELLEMSSTMRAGSMEIEFAPGIRLNMAGCSMKPAAFIAMCHALIDSVETGESSNHNAFDIHSTASSNVDVEALTIRLLAKFAKADGVITRSQIDAFEIIFDSMTDNDPSEKRRYIEIFNRAKNEDVSIDYVARQFAADLHTDFLIEIYALLWQFAMTDGAPSAKEHEILRRLPNIFGLPPTAYEKVSEQFLHEDSTSEKPASQSNNDLAQHFQLLGCAQNASDADLKKAYRRKMSSLHPDKLQAKELADELIEFATQQVQKINYAYEQILKHRHA